MKNKTVFWGYTQELVAAGLIVWCAILWWGVNPIVNFVRTAAIDVAASFCVVLFAASMGFLWSFYTKGDTDFYRWLEERGAFDVYVKASLYVVGVSFFALAFLVLLKYINNQFFGLVAIYFLVLDVINLYTLVFNVTGIMKLNAKFNVRQKNKN